MKNYNWIYFVLFLFLMQSCFTDDPRIDREYAIKNDSEVEVKINFLLADMATFQSAIIINNGQTSDFQMIEIRESILTDPNSDVPSSTFPTGSAVLIFNNSKTFTTSVSSVNEQIVFSEPINRNLFRNGNYEDIGNDQFVFTITQEDFENAIPCDGPCE